MPHGKSCSAYAAKLISSALKIIFCQLYFSLQKLFPVLSKIMSHFKWWQISVRQTFDETAIFSIEFSWHMAFCNMPLHAETVQKPYRIDIHTIFGICHMAKPCFVAFCHTAQCGRISRVQTYECETWQLCLHGPT